MNPKKDATIIHEGVRITQWESDDGIPQVPLDARLRFAARDGGVRQWTASLQAAADGVVEDERPYHAGEDLVLNGLELDLVAEIEVAYAEAGLY